MLDPGELGRDHLRLADALRMLRKASGLSGERLAQHAHMSQSKVSRIETGRTLPTVMDVERIVKVLSVPPVEAAKLLTLAKMANTGFTSRRHGRQRGAVNRQQDFATLMSQSVEIRYLLPTMLSGLLQTPAYVHSNVNHPLSTLSAEERAKLVAAKLARQSVLDERGKRFVFVLTESAVRCQVASRTDMAVQVDHLESLDRRPAVDIEVIPIDTHLPNAPINIFAVYDERLVTVETEAGTLALRDPLDVREHLELFEYFRAHALKGQASRDFLRAIADDFRRIP